MTTRKSLVLTALLAVSPVFLQADVADFVPLPQIVQAADGKFTLDAATTIVAPTALANEANFLANRLRVTAMLPAPVATSGKGITLAVDASLPAEGYVLDVATAGVSIRGGSPAGVFYGIQTFLQCLPAAALGREAVANAQWSVTGLHVEDAPLTTWRGLHLDSSRHFQPKEFIFKFIDSMAAQKLNRMHWHLVDSEAWRLEIKKYPKLVQVTKDAPAYYPEEIPTNPTFRAKYRYGYFHGGGYYSQQDVREIVAHAAKRHVTIIPEIEFPGHAMALLTAYPEIGTTGKIPEVRSNITPDLIGTHPKAIAFLKDVLDETMAMFPGKWIHFGGDEAPKGQWKKDPATQKRIDELGLRVSPEDPKHPNASEDALQAWMFNELAAHIAKKGRSAVGWEEIMHGDNINKLAKGSVIMPWLSAANGAKAANAGFGVVHTAVGPFYLDSYQVSDPGEPSTLYKGPMTAENIHRFNLFPAGLTEDGRKNILGAQGQLWSELMPRTDDVEYQAYPRACAIAELTWTNPDRRADTAGFMLRLASHGARLSALGLNHRRVAPPATLAWSPQFLAAGKDWIVNLPAGATASLTAGKPLKVEFKYRSGTHGLDISGVELLADGKSVASDTHDGFAGGQPRDAAYTVTLPQGTSATKLSLKISAKGRDGSDSTGEILFSEGN